MLSCDLELILDCQMNINLLRTLIQGAFQYHNRNTERQAGAGDRGFIRDRRGSGVPLRTAWSQCGHHGETRAPATEGETEGWIKYGGGGYHCRR